MNFLVLGKFLKSFWREIAIVLLIVGLYVGGSVMAGVYSNKIDALNASIAQANETAGGLNQKIEGLRDDNQVYRKTLQNIEVLTEQLRTEVQTSQGDINKMVQEQQRVTNRVNQIDLSGLSCKGKFDWMIEEAQRANPQGAKK